MAARTVAVGIVIAIIAAAAVFFVIQQPPSNVPSTSPSTTIAGNTSTNNCHVFRPNGPGTSADAALVGSCSNALPQYVAQFKGNGTEGSYVSINPATTLTDFHSITVLVWAYLPGNISSYRSIFDGGYFAAPYGWLMQVPPIKGVYMVYLKNSAGSSTPGHPMSLALGTWAQYGFMWDGSQWWYIENGNRTLVGPFNGTLSSSSVGLSIGAGANPQGNYYTGSLANVQIYNTSLNATELQYLYNEGIGGAPVRPQNLAGWWPLNGDTNDYSGNGNNGTAYNLTFNDSWQTGYNG